jgi:hypothetical protein
VKNLIIILVVLTLSAITTNANTMYAGISVSFSGKVTPVFNFTVDHSTPTYVNKFRPGEMHHLYMGIALLFLHNKWARSIGTVLVADDLAQHVLRVDTPVHMFSDQLGRYQWYRYLAR